MTCRDVRVDAAEQNTAVDDWSTATKVVLVVFLVVVLGVIAAGIYAMGVSP